MPSIKKMFSGWRAELRPGSVWIIVGVVLLGTAARFLVAKHGHTFDLDSYQIVTSITDHGGNVYAQTARYNYGPVWFNLLHIFDVVARHFDNSTQIFRGQIIAVLTLADIGIAVILWRRFGLFVASLFYLNPVSIVVTGFYNQFDGLAIVLALLAALALERSSQKVRYDKYLVAGVVLLGLSLMTKHLFFAFPLWLMWRQKGIMRKLVVLLVPVGIFLVSFLPYVADGATGILHNVFLYKSLHNAPFYTFILPPFLQHVISPMVLFAAALVVGSYVFRKQNLIKMCLWYTIVLVLFSPAVANQYLAIVMPAIIAFSVWLFLPYIFLACVLLWGMSPIGFHSAKLLAHLPVRIENMASPYIGINREYDWMLTFLFLGTVCYVWRQQIRNWSISLFKNFRTDFRKRLATFRT